MFTAEELQRYDRQIMIYGFGEAGQEKLKKAKVFLAGAGGLGSPVAIYLTAAGIGTLRIADHDKVELSNLNRQVLHWEENIGKRKVDSAAAKLGKFNPGVKIETIAETITEANISRLVGDSDLIVDAMDNLPTRYLLNKTAIQKGIPFFHGAVYGFEGRAMTVLPGKTACLNCLYHGASVPKEKFPVIGVTPAVIGCIQATEVIKYIVGLGELLTDRLLNFDALRMKFNEFKINRDPNCEVCGNKAKRVKKK
ncbi:MAG: adenylyltransferase [Chloroflexi bacterium RBG_13_51_18]|nr:MAG: adenylyltransferase [Chloroflexi bacterium RBG_13_51_18]